MKCVDGKFYWINLYDYITIGKYCSRFNDFALCGEEQTFGADGIYVGKKLIVIKECKLDGEIV